jgi:anthranilate synthase component 1
MVVPDKPEFLQKVAGGKRMPIYRDLLADIETPLSAYWKLSHDQTYSFLLESVTGGEQVSRYSLLGIKPEKVVRTKGNLAWGVGRRALGEDSNSAAIQDNGVGRRASGVGEDPHASRLTPYALPPGQDPLDLLKQELQGKPLIPVPDLPAFIGGAVGMMSYDLVRFFEKLPDGPVDDLQMPDLAMMVTDTVVVFDHAKNVIRVIALADEETYDEKATQIDEIIEKLRAPLPPLPDPDSLVNDKSHPAPADPQPAKSNQTKEQFEANVERMREYIAAGDGIQMVPSQRFETDVTAHPITIYRALRSLNPSPYMFLMRFGDFDIVGASPELLVSLHGKKARVRPIAGTRWRGKTIEEDNQLEKELLADEKERAEHIMLVDLGRNDLGRVCEFGSVKVEELMSIERYSHVMHIVSDVTGTIQPDKDAFDLIRASFPAGTVSGAPKVRAMQIIDELEPTRRGLYAGSVGFFSASGDFDGCIAIRSITLKDGKAYVQAGGGVVHDSVPEREYEESCNKAKAALRAIEIAQSGL